MAPILHLLGNPVSPVAVVSRLKFDDGDIPWDENDSLNLALLIVFCSTLGALIVALLIIGIYFICVYSGGINDTSYYAATNFQFPGQSYVDEQVLIEEEERYLPLLPKKDQQYYERAKIFEEINPPVLTKMGSEIREIQQQQIDERGLHAFQFTHDEDPFNPKFIVEDKTDISFLTNDPTSVVLNLPLPVKSRERDTIYFEVKLFELPGYDPSKIESSNLSDIPVDHSKLEQSTEPAFDIGLVTKPYPDFRLPGYNKYSVSYENNGKVRINRPFDNAPEILPKLSEGDVIGVGFRPSSGSVFFTRNGKKHYDIIHGMKLNLYPAIGSMNCANYKFQVNLGQLGFVFIEANVKKWGLAKNYGSLGAPPAYGKENDESTLLMKGDTIPPKYPSEEDFFDNVFKRFKVFPSEEDEFDKAGPSEKTPLLQSTHNQYSARPPSYVSDSTSTATSNDDKEPLEPVDETTDSQMDINERLYEQRSSVYGHEDGSTDFMDETANIAARINLDNNEGTSVQKSLHKLQVDIASDTEIDDTQDPNTTINTILSDSSNSSKEHNVSLIRNNHKNNSSKSPMSPTSQRSSQKKKKHKKKGKKKSRGTTF